MSATSFRASATCSPEARLSAAAGGLGGGFDTLDLLHETAEHHDAFEKASPPHDWWDWYAAYMDARERGSTPEEASVAAGEYMAEVKHVVVSPG